jgi:hypothetical protein
MNPSVQAAASIAVVGFAIIAVFQGALALGAPLGRAAWGGGQVTLPDRLRMASAIAVVVWVAAALIVADRGGLLSLPVPDAVTFWATWILVPLLAIAAAMNFASSSPWERFGWAPLALLLSALCLWLSLNAPAQ